MKHVTIHVICEHALIFIIKMPLFQPDHINICVSLLLTGAFLFKLLTDLLHPSNKLNLLFVSNNIQRYFLNHSWLMSSFRF